jgi:predicted  nucleic acid-binding Zn-ribbon protein
MLGKCPECKGLVSDTAKSCPHCGYDIATHVKKRDEARARDRANNAAVEKALENSTSPTAKTTLDILKKSGFF